jgi:hypothetical protein
LSGNVIVTDEGPFNLAGTPAISGVDGRTEAGCRK